MALIHPRSLERWQEWQASRHRARQFKHAVTGAIRSRRADAPSQPGLMLHSRGGDDNDRRILIAVDSASPTSRTSLLTALPYLSAAVHRATGRTFKELLLEKRLSKAAQLLRETRLTTQDIILAVGYENTSYFYRAFRARFGVTPKDYRKKRGGDFLLQAT